MKDNDMERSAILSDNSRLVALDGLRGVAALAVGWMHAGQYFRAWPTVTHGFLAVDFFFCLSGFVIARAYDHRLASGMSVNEFVRRRFVRLYPMILIGVFLGSLLTIMNASLGGGSSPAVAALYAIAAFLLIPIGLLFGDQAFPVNNPMWSLFFEFFANIVYARFIGPYQTIRLLALAAASCVVLAATCLTCGSLAYIGWLGTGSFLLGFGRVLYPFLAGVLIFRRKISFRLSAISIEALALVLLCLLMMPIASSGSYDFIAVAVLLPLITALAASATVMPSRNGMWALAGELSYPFYLIHEPVIRAVARACGRFHLFAAHAEWSALLSIAASIAASAVAMRLVEQPLRTRFGQLLLSPRVHGASRCRGAPEGPHA